MNFDSDKESYSSVHVPTTSKFSNLETHPTYSSQEDIFSEAFKQIPPIKSYDNEQDYPLVKSPQAPYTEFENSKTGLSLPGADDGYPQSGFESPNSVSHYETSVEYHEPRTPYSESLKTGPSKAYIAPIYNVPDPKEVMFNHRQAPVKYPLKSKTSKSTYSQRIGSYEPPIEVGVIGEYAGGDHNEYSSHYSEDYHHKPKKHHFEKGGGDSFKSDHHSSHGEKGDKGFKKYNDFDEGEMGHHGKEGKKGYYDKESGYKKSHHHEGDKYGEVHGKLHGDKGTKYGESEGHKKGHKTSGYHNIFHKDEFKKEHKFYDDAHKHGYHDKHGGYHTNHDKKHGHKSSGGFHDSDFKHGHKGSSGTYKKGHFDQDHKGHKAKSGHESHYNHHDDYDKKSGHSEKNKFGYKHGH